MGPLGPMLGTYWHNMLGHMMLGGALNPWNDKLCPGPRRSERCRKVILPTRMAKLRGSIYSQSANINVTHTSWIVKLLGFASFWSIPWHGPGVLALGTFPRIAFLKLSERRGRSHSLWMGWEALEDGHPSLDRKLPGSDYSSSCCYSLFSVKSMFSEILRNICHFFFKGLQTNRFGDAPWCSNFVEDC